MATNKDTVIVYGEVQNTSEFAVFFSVNGVTGKWIPRSQILEDRGQSKKVFIRIPRWLAEEKGFV